MTLLDRWARIIVVLITIVLSSLPVLSGEPASDLTPRQPVWKNGELAPPLPDDPAARAAALAEVQKRAASRPATPAMARTVSYTTSEPAVVHGVSVKPRHETVPVAPDPRVSEWLANLYSRLRAPDSANSSSDAQPDAEAKNRMIIQEAPAASSELASFDGIDDTGITPASPDIAVGPNHLVIATTSRITAMNKCGEVLFSSTIQAFLGRSATANYYLPRLIYDEWNSRFIMVCVGTESNNSISTLYVAYSESPDPTGPWTHYALASPGWPGLKDFPGVSVTPDQVYVTWDRYNLGTFAFETAVIGEIDRADFYNGGSTTLSLRTGMTNPNDGSPVLSIRPAQMQTFGGSAYFIDSDWAGDDFMTLWKITGAPGASVLTSYDVVVGAYIIPPDVAPPNATLLDAGDCRILDAVYSSNRIYTVHTESLIARPSVTVTYIDVNTLAFDETAYIPSPGYANAFGGIDLDDNDQLFSVYCNWGSGRFPSIDYRVTRFTPTGNFGGGIIFNGTDNFVRGIQPYRWGLYSGCVRDPFDDRTMWVHAVYASSFPANSWTTRVAAVTMYAPGQLSVTSPSLNYAGGFEGGPFSPDVFTFNLQNTGQTAVNWNLTDIPGWLTAGQNAGALAPASSQTVSLQLAPQAYTLPAGTYSQFVSFDNCTGSGTELEFVGLGVGFDGSCPGAELPVYPKSVLPTIGTASSEPGMFFTAIENATVCAVDVTAELIDIPQLVYARIYEANGTTRGTLIAESLIQLVLPGDTKHSIPMAVELEACKDYEVSVEFTGTVSHTDYNELGLGLPNDVGGILRMRDGSDAGNAAAGEVAPIQVVTTPSTCESSGIMDLGGSKAIAGNSPTATGFFVQPQRTVRLCTVGLYVAAAAGSKVTARVHASSGFTRDYLVSEGTAIISGPFLNYVDVPISALLVGGYEYDIEVLLNGQSFYEINATGSTPYTVSGVFKILMGEANGFFPDFVPTIRLGWTDDDAGVPFTLGKPGGPYPAPVVLSQPVSNGAYVTSLINQQMYSLGVYADVPAGFFVTADVYHAVGTTRGTSMAHASVMSEASGLRWHDVPVTVSLNAGGEYDFAVIITDGSARGWLDTPGLPFNVSGALQVRDGESGGSAANDKLIYLRMNACNDTATPVLSGPARTPMLLDPPVPNPASDLVRFGYSIDEPGPVDITVYDVAGRRVATVLTTSSAKSGRAGVEYDASRLASGIYFVKLKTRTGDVSRKFVVTH